MKSDVDFEAAGAPPTRVELAACWFIGPGFWPVMTAITAILLAIATVIGWAQEQAPAPDAAPDVLRAPGPAFTAKVIGVHDGDTVTVLRDGNVQVKIRLAGIDAPELRQDFGSAAKESAGELAVGDVMIRPGATDRYGRTVADVVLADGRTLNREQVARGMAWWYREYAPKDLELARLESEAKRAGRGLWRDPSPIPPWEWRNGPATPPLGVEAVVGNRSSRVYHRPTCASLRKMATGNRVEFSKAGEAEKAGYRKAGDCR
jgi:micrococcal nuclease